MIASTVISAPLTAQIATSSVGFIHSERSLTAIAAIPAPNVMCLYACIILGITVILAALTTMWIAVVADSITWVVEAVGEMRP